MKSRSPGARSAALEWTTADLFAQSHAPAPLDPLPARLERPLRDVRPPVSNLEPLHAARPRPLWYAVVFPDLDDSARFDALLQRLCRMAFAFTPLVSLEAPNALLLEIRGSVKLFGTVATLHEDIDAMWGRFSLQYRSAVTPTTLGSLWCARGGKRVLIEPSGALAGGLADLPVGCTAWPDDWLYTLRCMGVTRIGDLARLPRAGIARRLSPRAVLDLDVALGRQPMPRRVFVSRVRFRERHDFEAEIDTVAYLQKAVEPLIERCAVFLRQRQAGVQALQLELRHRSLPPTRMRMGLAGITGERRRLTDVIHLELERLVLTAPVRALQLSSGPLQPLSAASIEAFAGSVGGACRGHARDTAPQLIERLRARFGESAVYGLCPVAAHRPEAAWRRIHELRPCEPMRRDEARTASVVAYGSDMPRPVWLLDEPVPLSAADLRQLQAVGSARGQGPERIESGWWDGQDVMRDYYVLRRVSGARCWVFQERRSRAWYLHGMFA